MKQIVPKKPPTVWFTSSTENIDERCMSTSLSYRFYLLSFDLKTGEWRSQKSSPVSFENSSRVEKNEKNTIVWKLRSAQTLSSPWQPQNLHYATNQGLKAENTTTELWPPNPKEFEIAARWWCGFVSIVVV